MILRISNFLFEGDKTSKKYTEEEDVVAKNTDDKKDSSSGSDISLKASLEKPKKGKLKIKWAKPNLAKEIHHYNEKVKTEFYQHNIDISNKDIAKVKPEDTKFYKYILSPFQKGKLLELPLYSEDEFQVTKIQNLDSYEYENIVAGAYGKGYGEVMRKVSSDLKESGSLTLPAPIVIRFVNFGETRRSGESSYFLFAGNRRVNLALYYGIPIKVWLIDLIPSRRDVREFADKKGVLRKGEEFFNDLIKKRTGKDNLDSLSARERFNVIQSLKSF